ncbi:MAG: M1 family metallopeptidase [Clostridia bacterium]|nr:M1 family metallopeptidase [Clostridia bacterium]
MMKRIIWAISMIAVLLMLCAPFAQAEENGRNRYRMDVTLTEKKLPMRRMLLEIDMTVDVFNDSADAWTDLCFRDYMHSYIEASSIGGLLMKSGVEEASCGGEALEVAVAEDESIVYVKLNEPLGPGERTIVSLKYKAHVPSGYQRSNFGSVRGAISTATCELSQFYPMLAIWQDGKWMADEYFSDGECFFTRCSDYEITLRLPEKYTDVIASGDEQPVSSADGESVWRITSENMRDVTIVATNEMDMLTGEICGVTVNSWFSRNSNPDDVRGEMYLETALASVEAFTEAFGPYPYGELDVLDSNIEAGGMEAPGLIRINQMYGAMLMDLEKDSATAQMLQQEIRKVVAHETAHEWFYGVVGNDQYNEAWLDESFASYGETVYLRHVGDNGERVKEDMRMYADWSLGSGLTVDRSPKELGGDYITAVYQRGASFLYQLERVMGEDFTEFIRAYYAAYSFKEADTEGFLEMLAPYIEDNETAQGVVQRYLDRAKDLY